LICEEDEDWFMELIMKSSREKNREDLERILRKLPENQNA